MPTPCYISIEGKTQGNITAGAFTAESVGNIYVQGHEDEMLVQQFDHIVTVPTDPQSGQPSGQRAHRPFKFTVALNKAVPLLYNGVSLDIENYCTLRLFFDLSTLAGLSRRNLPEAGIRLLFQI